MNFHKKKELAFYKILEDELNRRSNHDFVRITLLRCKSFENKLLNIMISKENEIARRTAKSEHNKAGFRGRKALNSDIVGRFPRCTARLPSLCLDPIMWWAGFHSLVASIGRLSPSVTILHIFPGRMRPNPYRDCGLILSIGVIY